MTAAPRLTIAALLAASCLALGDIPVAAWQSEQAAEEAAAAARGGNLTRFNPLIGSWRGVGQPQRGSRRGAWTEAVDCQWDFTGRQPAIVLTATDGRQFDSLRLGIDPESERLILTQKFGDQTRDFSGPLPEKWPSELQFLSEADDGTSFRCTLQQLSDIRVVLLLEQRSTPTGSFRRIAGIGYTREGARLAQAGGSQRKCVVTGGLGTIAVVHEGKTWYVCCEGCRQVFEQSPDEIIAEYRRSLEETGKPTP
ncbi:MAG: hypothetical protein R3C19_06220 [Planctomycetaceae bacterium]